MKNDRLIYLTSKKLSDTLEENEELELQKILQENLSNKNFYDQLIKDWEESAKYRLSSKVDIEASWEEFKRQVETPKKVSILTLGNLSKVAASFLIIVFLGTYFFRPEPGEIYQTKAEETLALTLTDGSVIHLNELSFVVLKGSYGEKEREVQFEGEAFFEVTRNPDIPFIISTSNSEVEVLGTSFNVDSRINSEITEVDVVTGKVAFRHKKDRRNQIFLTAGMMGVLDEKTRVIQSSSYENANFLSWKENRLEFDDISMNKVLEDVSKHFRIQFEVSSTEILNCKFTSTFNDPTPEEVIEVITKTFDLSYQQVENTIQLSGTGCSESNSSNN